MGYGYKFEVCSYKGNLTCPKGLKSSKLLND